MSVVIVAVGITIAVFLAVMFVPGINRKLRGKPDLRENRQRQVLLEKILDAHGKCAVDEAVSRAEHDLNNLLLALSMEAARLSSVRADEQDLRTTIATINQIVSEGRQIADALTTHAAEKTESSESCDIVEECQVIAEFWGRACGTGPRVEMALDTQQSPIMCSQAREFRLLVLELCCVATDFVVASEGGAAISIGNSGRGEARLSIDCDKSVTGPGNHARLSRISSLAERVCGDFHSHSDGDERCTIVVSIPVTAAK